MDTVINIGRCAICGIESTESLTRLTAKGLQTLVDAAVKDDDDTLKHYLLSQQSASLSVHHSCRRQYTDTRNISKLSSDDDGPSAK